MSEEEVQGGVPVTFYVLPTEEDQPPRAWMIQPEVVALDDERVPEEVREKIKEAEEQLPEEVRSEDPGVMIGQVREMVTWSRDTGTWMRETGVPLPAELAEQVTEHAKSLGVEW